MLLALAYLGMKLASTLAIVTLRITRMDTEEGSFLQVDGRLEAESLSELERACEGASSPLTLNLEGVQWIDDRAAEALRRLMASGTVVTSASPYVALRLKNKGEETSPPKTKGGSP